MSTANQRIIDAWFPCAAVDEACGNPAGSGKNEKAIFTWFASRPIAQARAAVATALLGDQPGTRHLIDSADPRRRGRHRQTCRRRQRLLSRTASRLYSTCSPAAASFPLRRHVSARPRSASISALSPPSRAVSSPTIPCETGRRNRRCRGYPLRKRTRCCSGTAAGHG